MRSGSRQPGLSGRTLVSPAAMPRCSRSVRPILAVEARDRRPVPIQALRQFDAGCHHTRRLESGVFPGESLDAAHEEAGCDEQHHGEADLGRDENAARERASRPPRRAPDAGLERRVQIGSRQDQRRHHPEDERGEKRRADRECEGAAIDGDLIEPRDFERRETDQQEHPDGGAGDADQRARQREHHALGQQLLDQAAAAGADGRPQRHLALAHGGARQKEVGHVDARDEEQQPHRAEQ